MNGLAAGYGAYLDYYVPVSRTVSEVFVELNDLIISWTMRSQGTKPL